MKPESNIELKAQLHDFAAARETAMRLATEYVGIQHQVDTYFHCPQGRMKLREITELPQPGAIASDEPARKKAELIWYDRADELDSKASNYRRTPISDPRRIGQLKTEMGIHVVVEKRREIFLYRNVRIHLDVVVDLGTFIEFEAVLGEGIGATAGHTQVANLKSEFGITPADLLSCSYADLLLEKSQHMLSSRQHCNS